MVNNLVSSGKAEKKKQKENFSMATNKDKLQGMAHPNTIKRCSQNSGRPGTIKQNICDAKDTKNNRL